MKQMEMALYFNGYEYPLQRYKTVNRFGGIICNLYILHTSSSSYVFAYLQRSVALSNL